MMNTRQSITHLVLVLFVLLSGCKQRGGSGCWWKTHHPVSGNEPIHFHPFTGRVFGFRGFAPIDRVSWSRSDARTVGPTDFWAHGASMQSICKKPAFGYMKFRMIPMSGLGEV